MLHLWMFVLLEIFKWFKSIDDNLTGYSLHVIGGTQNLVYNSLTDILVFRSCWYFEKKTFLIRGLLLLSISSPVRTVLA